MWIRILFLLVLNSGFTYQRQIQAEVLLPDPTSEQKVPINHGSLKSLLNVVKTINTAQSQTLKFRKSVNQGKVCIKPTTAIENSLIHTLKLALNMKPPKAKKCYKVSPKPTKPKKEVNLKCDCLEKNKLLGINSFELTESFVDCPCKIGTNKKETGLELIVPLGRITAPLVPERELTILTRNVGEEQAILVELGLTAIPGTTVTKAFNCTNRGENTSIGTVNMCRTCQFTIALPPNFFPRFLVHFTCGDTNDNSCFGNSGICAKTQRDTPVAELNKITGEILLTRTIRLTTCCSCEILASHPFAQLV